MKTGRVLYYPRNGRVIKARGTRSGMLSKHTELGTRCSCGKPGLPTAGIHSLAFPLGAAAISRCKRALKMHDTDRPSAIRQDDTETCFCLFSLLINLRSAITPNAFCGNNGVLLIYKFDPKIIYFFQHKCVFFYGNHLELPHSFTSEKQLYCFQC
jgi:hypothetical protein